MIPSQSQVIEHRLKSKQTYNIACYDDSTGQPFNFTGYTVTAYVRAYPGSTTDLAAGTLAITPTPGASGIVTVVIEAADLATLAPGDYVLGLGAVRSADSIHFQRLLRLLPAIGVA